MANSFQEALILEIRQILIPLEGAARSEEECALLFRRLGWNIDNLDNIDTSKLASLFAKSCSGIEELLKSSPQDLDDIVRSFRELVPIFRGIQNMAILAKTGGDLPQEFSDVGKDLIEFLITDYLRTYHPVAYYLCVLLTLIQDPAEIDPSNAPQPVLANDQLARFVQPKPCLRLTNLEPLLKNPVSYLCNEYWPNDLATLADAELAAGRLFQRLAWLFQRIPHVRAIYGVSRNLSKEYGWDWGAYGNRIMSHALTILCRFPKFSIDENDGSVSSTDDASLGATFSLSSQDCENLGLVVSPWGDFSLSTPIGQWFVLSKLSASSEKAFAIGPTGFQLLVGGDPNVTGSLNLRRLPSIENEPTFLLGGITGTRLEVSSVQISGAIDFSEQSLSGNVLLQVGKSSVVVQAGNGDGFLQQILPKQDIRVDFDLVVGWSNKTGFYLGGGAGLEATLPINLDIFNSVKIDTVYLALRTTDTQDSSNGAIQVVTATTATVRLGPVSAVVEQFGLQATLSFPERGGNLGVANLDLGFKSPKGVGLSIEAQAVTGSGYLSYESDKQQYTGILQLEIAEKISLSAVGLLTTRMPDGSKGYSLLVLLSTQFEPGIQLGYGFVLKGLGGLVGVNRTVSTDVLRDGLHRGVLDSILFPQNIVEQAPQVVSNLGTIFPPAQDRFLFGPMAIIEWGGVVPLVTMELGIMLEAPEPVRVVMVGRLRIFLPRKEESAPIRLQLDALGVIDFQSGNIALDAVLYDSVIGPYVVTGEMALRANFGAQPMFILSVGGFHPAFQVPAGFPSLERVTFTLAKQAGVEVRLQLSAYFALTSNTIQFGARLDLWAKVGIFKLSGELGFDALIHLNPFGLVASFEGAVAVRVKNVVLMGITLQMNLTGPSPWYGWGKARFHYLFGSVTKEFDIQVGEEAPLQSPPPIHAAQVLREELRNPDNWSSQLPVGANPLVTFRGDANLPKDATEQARKKVLVHPLAEVQVSQRRVPLVGPDEAITQFGNTTPEGDTTFALTGRVASGVVDNLSTSPVSDWFAPAEFYTMSDAEKLSAPSFELKPSGIRFQFTGYTCGKPEGKPVPPAITDPTRADQHPLSTTMLSRVAPWGAAGQAQIRASGPARYRQPSGPKQMVAVKPSTYCVGIREGKGLEKRSLTYTAAQVQARLMRNAQPKALAAVVPDIGMVE